MKFERKLIRGKEGQYSKYNIDIEYNIVEVIFDRENENDLKLLNEAFTKGMELSDLVCKNAANNSIQAREKSTLRINAISGTLAEFAWKEYINYSYGKEVVDFTEYIDPSNQIDLKLINSDVKIEVRSSFVRNGLQFALCNKKYIFDILGPYTNSYKRNETFKNFYVRVLYPINYSQFMSYFSQKKVVVYLTCGATLEMMKNEKIFKYKDLNPNESLIKIKSKYRVIPFDKGLDTIKITQLILNEVSDKNEFKFIVNE